MNVLSLQITWTSLKTSGPYPVWAELLITVKNFADRRMLRAVHFSKLDRAKMMENYVGYPLDLMSFIIDNGKIKSVEAHTYNAVKNWKTGERDISAGASNAFVSKFSEFCAG